MYSMNLIDAQPLPQAGSDRLQQTLAHWNRRRLAPGFPVGDWEAHFAEESRMKALEAGFLDSLRAEVAARARLAPRSADAFVSWFEDLANTGPGQGDPLFAWLAEEATFEQMRWFIEQEAAGEAGFDDLVALTQIKLPTGPKLELARNYWDEMGCGNPRGVHGTMLAALAETLRIAPTIEGTVWESLALANTMTGLATNRNYAWHSVGALGVIELTAPGRSACVARGLRRLGLSERQRRYFDLHALLDVKHSREWNREALGPLVAEDPRRAEAMAEGALMRLLCGQRCFARYRAHLWGR